MSSSSSNFLLEKLKEGFIGSGWKKQYIEVISSTMNVWDSTSSSNFSWIYIKSNVAPKYSLDITRELIVSEDNHLRPFATRIVDAKRRINMVFSSDEYTMKAFRDALKAATTVATQATATAASSGPNECEDDEVDSDEDDRREKERKKSGGQRRPLSSFWAGFTSSVVQQSELEQISGSASVLQPNVQLFELGKRIEALEREAVKLDEEAKRVWRSRDHKIFDEQILDLTATIRELKAERDKVLRPTERRTAIEKEILHVQEILMKIKKKQLFPNSQLAFANFDAGVYVAFEDYWVEYIKGGVSLEVTRAPSPSSPAAAVVNVSVQSKSKSPIEAEGDVLTLRVKYFGLKLKGEADSGVPTIKLKSAKITMSLRLIAGAIFDVQQNKWTTSGKQFGLQLVAFRGPFGLGRQTVGLLLALLEPGIRNNFTAALPVELGQYLAHAVASGEPISLLGQFEVAGIELGQLKVPMSQSSLLAYSTGGGLTPIALELFTVLQKGQLKKEKPLYSLVDFLLYLRAMRRHPLVWGKAETLWKQACAIFSGLIRTPSSVPPPPPPPPPQSSPSPTLPKGHARSSVVAFEDTFFTSLLCWADELQRKSPHQNCKTGIIVGHQRPQHPKIK